jgi:hypothetical protein
VKDYKVIRVTFDNPIGGVNRDRYAFKTILDLKAGERVIVECATGLQVCTVREVDCNAYRSAATKWAFQKVDEARLSFLKGRDAEYRKAWARRKELIGRLNGKLEAQESWDMYMKLAASDPEARDMLRELRDIEALGCTSRNIEYIFEAK